MDNKLATGAYDRVEQQW